MVTSHFHLLTRRPQSKISEGMPLLDGRLFWVEPCSPSLELTGQGDNRPSIQVSRMKAALFALQLNDVRHRDTHHVTLTSPPATRSQLRLRCTHATRLPPRSLPTHTHALRERYAPSRQATTLRFKLLKHQLLHQA